MFGKGFELLYRRRTVHVGRDQRDFFFSLMSLRASLALEVVLPEPCRPAMRMTAGGCVARLSALFSSPMMRTSSLLTVLIKAWSGESFRLTSWPTAAFFDGLDDFFDDRQGNVRLNQRHAYVAQRLGDVFFGDAALAAQFFEGALQASLRLSNMGFP